jgi:hypothetical protein
VIGSVILPYSKLGKSGEQALRNFFRIRDKNNTAN